MRVVRAFFDTDDERVTETRTYLVDSLSSNADIIVSEMLRNRNDPRFIYTEIVEEERNATAL